jgi:membrane-associated phospholipid phosphatase
MTWWSHLSALGGLDITAPVAFGVTAWLACARGWRLALAWCLLFGAALAIAAISQMAFIGWGLGIESLSFTGFSGHAMRAAAVFPVALFLLAHQTGGWWQRALVLAGALLAVGVAAARVQVGAHTPSEAVAGCLLGLGTAALFMAHALATAARLAGSGRPAAARRCARLAPVAHCRRAEAVRARPHLPARGVGAYRGTVPAALRAGARALRLPVHLMY